MAQDRGNEVLLITGSSGFIGSAAIRRFAASYRLVVPDQEGPPHPPPNAEGVWGDLTSDTNVEEAFERVRRGYGERIAAVIHLAAYYDFSGEPSPKYEQVTVRGTERICASFGASRSAGSSSPAPCWSTLRASRG